MKFFFHINYSFRFTNQLKCHKKPFRIVCNLLPQANRKLLRDLRLEFRAATSPTTQHFHGHICHSVYCLHYGYFTNPVTITHSIDIITQFMTLNSQQILPKKHNNTRKMNPHSGVPRESHGTNFNVSFRFASIAVIRPFLEHA
jgi:hypothetical protein